MAFLYRLSPEELAVKEEKRRALRAGLASQIEGKSRALSASPSDNLNVVSSSQSLSIRRSSSSPSGLSTSPTQKHGRSSSFMSALADLHGGPDAEERLRKERAQEVLRSQLAQQVRERAGVARWVILVHHQQRQRCPFTQLRLVHLSLPGGALPQLLG